MKLFVALLVIVGWCGYDEQGCHVPMPDPPGPIADAAPAPDVDCSACDDGTPDLPDGGSACPSECTPPF